MNKWSRLDFLIIAVVEVFLIGCLLNLVIYVLFGGGLTTTIIVFVVWLCTVLFTPLVNRFFINVIDNHGEVITNPYFTYKTPLTDADILRLGPTPAMREVGPGIQGLVLGERVSWRIDLGKQIRLSDPNDPIVAYTKDNVAVRVPWQMILTPLRGYLVNLVRHSDETVRKHFTGLAIAKIVEIVSQEYAVLTEEQRKAGMKSIFEKVSDLKESFQGFLGGADEISDEEKQFGTFTNDPQLLDIQRSESFQKAVEAEQITEINRRAIEKLTADGKLSQRAALIGTLAAQGLSTDGLEDREITVKADIQGVPNAGTIIIGGMPFTGTPVGGSATPKKSDEGKTGGKKPKK